MAIAVLGVVSRLESSGDPQAVLAVRTRTYTAASISGGSLTASQAAAIVCNVDLSAVENKGRSFSPICLNWAPTALSWCRNGCLVLSAELGASTRAS
jgi:hypothetical protein